ncbi:MAG: reverse transcriptase domain-containing protein [Candidatus Komeilibacteria bacterium]
MQQGNFDFTLSGGGRNIRACHSLFNEIISLDNLVLAWQEFKLGKSSKKDVQAFEFSLEDNLWQLHSDLQSKKYEHSHYTSFYVQDPKLRHIHKANIRDRVLHHAVFRVLYPIFDKGFIFDSYSCRIDKGCHCSVNRLRSFSRKLSVNNTKNIFALKCDIKKFFDSINQDILYGLIAKKIKDKNVLSLTNIVIRSYETGLPLGNVTSQLFANIYMNELDQFVKHKLKQKYYMRYSDDFIILSRDKKELVDLITPIQQFLDSRLSLSLHPNKIIIRKFIQGFDWLGYVVLPNHRVIRTKTKKRMFNKLKQQSCQLRDNKITKKAYFRSQQSYLGILTHCKGYKLKQEIYNLSKHKK